MGIARQMLQIASGGMPPLVFDIGLFNGIAGPPSPADVDESEELMLLALHFLGKINASLLRRYPHLPRLYNSGLPYHHDWKVELWWSFLRALQVGHADCKVVVAALLAEKWARDIDARPFITSRLLEGQHAGTRMYHYRAHCPWSSLSIDAPPFFDSPVGPTCEPSPNPEQPGWIEDPSRVLGHGWELGFATTNRRPATAEFQERLAELLGYESRPVLGTLIPPIEEAGHFLAGALARRPPAYLQRVA